VSSLLLFQKSSEIPSGNKNLRFLEPPLITADKRIFCLAKSKALRYPIISAALLGLLFTDQLLIYQTQMKVEHAKEASKFQHSYGKIVTSQCSQQLPIQCGRLCILFIFLFKRPFCNGPETELKCKTGFRTYIIFSFYNIHTVGA